MPRVSSGEPAERVDPRLGFEADDHALATPNTSNRRVYTPEFKLNAVSTVIDEKRRPAEVADFFNLSEQTLSQWVTAYKKHGAMSFKLERRKVTFEAMELSWLRAENMHLRMLVKVLKNRIAEMPEE